MNLQEAKTYFTVFPTCCPWDMLNISYHRYHSYEIGPEVATRPRTPFFFPLEKIMLNDWPLKLFYFLFLYFTVADPFIDYILYIMMLNCITPINFTAYDL